VPHTGGHSESRDDVVHDAGAPPPATAQRASRSGRSAAPAIEPRLPADDHATVVTAAAARTAPPRAMETRVGGEQPLAISRAAERPPERTETLLQPALKPPLGPPLVAAPVRRGRRPVGPRKDGTQSPPTDQDAVTPELVPTGNGKVPVSTEVGRPLRRRATRAEDSVDVRVRIEPAPAADPRRVGVPRIERAIEPTAVGTESGTAGRARAPAAPFRGGEQPTIHVTIGRLEVRAVSPPASPAHRQRPQPAVMSLDDYLKERAGGGRA